ncbi:MAG: cytosine permease [Bacillota bacterium]
MKEKSVELLEDYASKPVPHEKTKGWLSMGLIWAGVGISLGMLLTGGILGEGLSFRQAIIAAFLGGLVLSIVTAVIGIIGAKTNLSTAMISQFTFGGKAIILIAMLQALGSYGWFGVQLGLFGDTASTAWEISTGRLISPNMFIIIGGILMVLTATLGYKALDKLSMTAVPLLLVLIFISVIRVLEGNTIGEIFALGGTGESLSLGAAASMVISSFIVGAVVAPDVSRYAKTPKDTVYASLMAFFIIVPVIVLVGSVLAQATGSSNLIDIMLALGFGVIALLVLMLAQWTSNDNNLYCSALGFAVIFKKWDKWKLTAFSGFIGIMLALGGIYDNLVPWLNILGIFIPPMAGVIAVDYYLFNKSHYKMSLLKDILNVRVVSFTAWVIGAVGSFISTYTLFTITTVPSLDGIIIAALAQLILLKITKEEMIISGNKLSA